MPMTYKEIRNNILFHHHKNIDFWYKLVGEMFEETHGFTEPGCLKRNLSGMTCVIEFDYAHYEWKIIEPEGAIWDGYVWKKV